MATLTLFLCPMDNHRSERLTDSDWAVITNAIPGFSSLLAREHLASTLEIRAFPAAKTLSPDGMYIVLDGGVDISLNGHGIATAGPADYFYEEHLVIDDLAIELMAATREDSRLVFLSKQNWAALPDDLKKECLALLFGDLVNIHLHEFQQPINCCNITAAALSLTALGFPSDVNDIFETCALPVSYVVNEGMTLGELYDVASSYIYAKGLRDEIGVELYYFDKGVMSREDLVNAIAESDRVGGDKDILVANFGVGIAHGKPDMGGGHFALIAKCNRSTGLVHMMDVHPEKYGKIWVTSIDRLFDAMADHDNSARRSRGLMRFIVKAHVEVRLSALAKSDCYPVNCTQYIDLTPEKRRHIFTRSTTNLNSFHVLSMGIGILDNHPVDVDEILDAADLSYTEALSLERTSAQMAAIAENYLSLHEDMNIRCSLVGLDDLSEVAREEWFKRQLLGIANNPKAFFMINIDYNEVVGFEAIHEPPRQHVETAHLQEFWCLCIDYLYESDVVILADMSPATSQIWRAPRAKVFNGLKEKPAPGLLRIEKTEMTKNPLEFHNIIEHHELVLFCDQAPESVTLQRVLANIGATEPRLVDVSGADMASTNMRKKLVTHSGQRHPPWLYFDGACLGTFDDVMSLVQRGELQTRLHDAGLSVLLRHETPSLDSNIFSYPKGGLTAAGEGGSNILLCCCGSPAAGGLPALIDRLVDVGHNVKLVPTASAETFFSDGGMQHIRQRLRPADIYRDDDEWNFQYIEYGMPIRAAHLALCDWADYVVVAPITCNTMGKIAHGVADNLLSSVLLAWPYGTKPAIICPSASADMWENAATRKNISVLKAAGAQIVGPRSGMLSNGRIATGMMAEADDILKAIEDATGLVESSHAIMKWGRAAGSDPRQWRRVLDALDEGIDINLVDQQNGDSLLHYASGGAGELTESGVKRGVPDVTAMGELIRRGIDIDIRNKYGFTALHVAAMNESLESVRLLIEAGADAGECLVSLAQVELPDDIRQALDPTCD